jgi:putative two-component system response regulator
MDGSGYTRGLQRDQIIFEARILAVTDEVEAMSSHRPGLGMDATLDEIEQGRVERYDPTVVDACVKMFREQGYVIA